MLLSQTALQLAEWLIGLLVICGSASPRSTDMLSRLEQACRLLWPVQSANTLRRWAAVSEAGWLDLAVSGPPQPRLTRRDAVIWLRRARCWLPAHLAAGSPAARSSGYPHALAGKRLLWHVSTGRFLQLSCQQRDRLHCCARPICLRISTLAVHIQASAGTWLHWPELNVLCLELRFLVGCKWLTGAQLDAKRCAAAQSDAVLVCMRPAASPDFKAEVVLAAIKAGLLVPASLSSLQPALSLAVQSRRCVRPPGLWQCCCAAA